MNNLLDFEGGEKGFQPFVVNKENVGKNVGKRICYVDHIDNRGQYYVRYGVLHSVRYSTLFLDDMDREVEIHRIRQAGIEKELEIEIEV